MSQLLELKQRLGAWLMRHSLTIFFGIMALLAFSILIGGKKSQDVKEDAEQVKTENVLTKKEVKAKEKAIGKLQDSIQVTTIYVDRIIHQRDSVKVIAKQESARADSAVKILSNENTTDPDADFSRVTGRLSAYKPAAYLTPDGDSLR